MCACALNCACVHVENSSKLLTIYLKVRYKDKEYLLQTFFQSNKNYHYNRTVYLTKNCITCIVKCYLIFQIWNEVHWPWIFLERVVHASLGNGGGGWDMRYSEQNVASIYFFSAKLALMSHARLDAIEICNT